METLRAVVKLIGIPGSLPFLLFGQFVGLALLFMGPTAARWGRRWLVGLLALYIVLSFQGTVDALIAGLRQGHQPLASASRAQGIDVVVLLGNGAIQVRLPPIGSVDILSSQSAHGALEAARVYRLLGTPTVLISGSGTNRLGSETTALAAVLKQLGVPAGRIALDSGSPTTEAQGRNVARWLRAAGKSRAVVVTAPEHVRRAVDVLRANGVSVVPSPSAVDYGDSPFWQPTRSALTGSRNALYEYFAILFYRLRGWTHV